MMTKEEMMKEALKDLIEEAKDADMDVKEYIDFICDDQFGLSYEEAVEQGAIQEFDFSLLDE